MSRLPRAEALVEKTVAEGAIPGIAVGVWEARNPEQPLCFARGLARKVPAAEPLTLGHRFDFASLTKVIATTSLVAALEDRGWLTGDTAIGAWVPSTRHASLTVNQLLSHTSGLPAWAPLWSTLVERFAGRPLWKVSRDSRRAIARAWLEGVVPEAPAGSRTLYSDIGFLILGYALEDLLGDRFERLVRRHVWGPMRLQGLEYRKVGAPAEESKDSRYVATEDSEWRGGVLQGQVHDDNTWALGGIAPHAGVFGTVHDVLGFARRCLEGHFSARVTREMWTRMPQPMGCERTPGWDTPSGPQSSAGKLLSQIPGVVGHLGYTGTSLWIDPMNRRAITILTNRVHPSRGEPGESAIKALRPALHDAILEDLG